MNRLNKVLITAAAALGLSVPAFAEGQVLGGDMGGIETLAMALVLVATVIFLQKFNK